MATMKMQVSFSDERRRVSGSWLSVLQGKGSLDESDWGFVSSDGEFRDLHLFFSVTQQFHNWKKSYSANNNDSSGFVAQLVSFIGF